MLGVSVFCVLQWNLDKTNLSRKVVGKMCMINYFCYFPLALVDICPRPLVPFSQISLKNSELKTTHGLSRTLYPTTFLETAVYNEVLDITNDIFCPSNSKIYGK